MRYIILPVLFLLLHATNVAGQETYGDNPAAGKIIKANGIEIYCESYGEGEPLLLLHGNSQSISDWQNQILEFSRYFKVIVPDTRAQGKSTFDNRELSYDLFADDVVALMDTLQLTKANVVGWSDGGNTGMSMALRYPSRIKTLITVGANYKLDTTAVSQDIITLLHESYKGETDLRQKRLIGLMLKYPQLTTGDLSRITTPTVVVAGEFDIILKQHSEEMVKAIRGSRLVIVPGTGHFIPNEMPEVFNALILRELGVKSKPKMTGRVVDSKTKAPVLYATIHFAKASDGAMSDLSGNFEVEPSSASDSLVVSAVGYESKRLSMRELKFPVYIELTPKVYMLHEVVVRAKPLTPQAILKKAVSRLDKNYPQTEYGVMMYVNQKWRRSRSDSTTHGEAIIQGFNKTGYARRVHAYFALMNKFYFKMIEQRRQDRSDSQRYMPYTSDIMYHDVIRFSNNPINKGNIKNFDLKFEDVLETATDTTYVISFRCKDPNYWNTAQTFSTEYVGKIFINAADFAITKFSAASIADRDLLAQKGKKSKWLPENQQTQFECTYVKTQGTYFPSTIKSWLISYKDNEKSPSIYYESQTIVYQLKLNNPEPIDPPKNNRMAAVKNVAFHEDFWRTFSVPHRL